MRISFFVLSVFLMLVISACNLPSGSSSPSLNDQAATIIAMTLQAATTPTPQTILNTPTAISIVTKSGGPAILTVTDNTNCRSGPGTNYAKLTTIPAGTTVTIVARYASGNYWIVTPADGSANCWVQGNLGTVTGDAAILPEITPVASENKGAPARPGYFKYTYECPFGNLTTVLTWTDNADNETGYRVYRYDQLLVELPANSNTYTDNTTLTAGTGINYGIEAFNEAGTSEQRTISFTCQ
ncbi:MAG: SH3 domain-containing protein [Anaerolineales bacterium]|nr:SH3 domain-containing protein [Anaerolineales bacterium]